MIKKEAKDARLYIGISGIIGAGKTTLADALSKLMDLPLYKEEQMGTEMLDRFYKDMDRYAFSFQIYLLNMRFRQQQQIVWSKQGGIGDRTIYEDGIFAKMLMQQGKMDIIEYETYRELFENMSNFMKHPNVIVHLDVSPDKALERIRERGRECEKGITLEYLQDLHHHYEDFLNDIAHIVLVIRVDWNEFHRAEEIADLVKQKWENISNVHTIKL